MKILHLFKFVFYTYILRPHTRGRRILYIDYASASPKEAKRRKNKKKILYGDG